MTHRSDPPQNRAPGPAALLLSAGDGQRMGGCAKGLLVLDDQTLVSRQAQHLLRAGLHPVCVLTGFEHTQVAQSLHNLPLQLAHNPHWTLGQMQSVLTGLAALPQGLDVLITLVDLPWLNSDHHQAMLTAWATRPTGVQALVPCVASQPGHPVLISADVVRACIGQHIPPRQWMTQHPDRTMYWPVNDPAHTLDIDTAAQWATCQACWPALPPLLFQETAHAANRH
jgi:molybdenum cofactor cytidylyltransferase